MMKSITVGDYELIPAEKSNGMEYSFSIRTKGGAPAGKAGVKAAEAKKACQLSITELDQGLSEKVVVKIVKKLTEFSLNRGFRTVILETGGSTVLTQAALKVGFKASETKDRYVLSEDIISAIISVISSL